MKYAFSNIFGDPFWLTTIPMGVFSWTIALVSSIINDASGSDSFPIFCWWGLAFEAFCILLTIYTAFTNKIRQYRNALLALLAIAVVYSTNSTNNFVWRDDTSSAAAAAGQILLSIINFIWILYFGTTKDEPVHAFIDSFAMQKKPLPMQYPVQQNSRVALHPEMSTAITDGNVEVSAPLNPMADTTTYPQVYSSSQLIRHGIPLHAANQGPETQDDSQNRAQGPMSHITSTRLSNARQLAPESQVVSGFSSIGSEQERGISSYKARAKFRYDANTMAGEIPFDEGEILDVIDISGKWWMCRRATGEEGMCPSNYLELLSPQLI